MQRLGPYELQATLAEGAQGRVYRARDLQCDRLVALKVELPDADPSRRERAAREAEVLGRLSHPNILRIHATGEDQGRRYLATELVEGESLQARLERGGPLPLAEAVAIARALAGALDHAHARGVLHRDVKPANVLLRRADGVPLLVDFGLARDVAATEALTRSGAVLGTLGYAAPEQVRGDLRAIGPATDVYGLGATLYAMLTGQPPSEGATVGELFVATCSRPPVPPSRLRPEVGAALERACLRCLAKEPAQRPATPREAAAELEGVDAPARERGAVRALGALAGVAVALAAVALLRPREGPAPPAAVTPAAPASPSEPAQAVSAAAPRAPDDDADVAGAPPAVQAERRWARGDIVGALMLSRGVTPPPTWYLEARWLRASFPESPLPPPDAPSPPMDERLAEVEAALLRGHGARANALARPLQLTATTGDAWLTIACAAFVAGDPGLAERSLGGALALDPTLAAAYTGRAFVRFLSGRPFNDALEDARKAVTLAPRDPFALVLLASLEQRAGRSEKALRLLDTAIRAEPRYTLAWYGRGNARYALRQLEAAITDYSRALELDDRLSEAWGNRAQVREELHDRAGAIADYERALARPLRPMTVADLHGRWRAALDRLRPPR